MIGGMDIHIEVPGGAAASRQMSDCSRGVPIEANLFQLVSPEDGTNEEYLSNDIDDASVLRHFGILKMGDHPVFDGFYALQR